MTDLAQFSGPWWALVQRHRQGKAIHVEEIARLVEREPIPDDLRATVASFMRDEYRKRTGVHSPAARMLDSGAALAIVSAMVEVETDRLRRWDSNARSPEGTALRNVAKALDIDYRTLKERLAT